MESFLDSLTDEQLDLFQAGVEMVKLSRRVNRHPQALAVAAAMAPIATPSPPPPLTPYGGKKLSKHRIFIPFVDHCVNGYKEVHDRLVNEMGNVRSRKIYINEDKKTAKITFDNPEDALQAAEFLDREYEGVKIYWKIVTRVAQIVIFQN